MLRFFKRVFVQPALKSGRSPRFLHGERAVTLKFLLTNNPANTVECVDPTNKQAFQGHVRR